MATNPTDVSNDPWNDEMLAKDAATVEQLRQQERHRLQTWKQLRDALKALEWMGLDEQGEPGYCPECFGTGRRGHSEACKLAAALTAAEEE